MSGESSNPIQNENIPNSSHFDSNALNTSFGSAVRDAVNEESLSFSDGILEYHHKRWTKNQLFLIDDQKRKVYVFRRNDIQGVAKMIREEPENGGKCYYLELKDGIKPYLWTIEGYSTTWPYASTSDAHRAFNEKLQEKLQVKIPLSSFKKMLMTFFSGDYQKLLEKELLINSVLYDENGVLRNTTTIDFDNSNFDENRFARLFFVKDGIIYCFNSSTIEGVAAVVESNPGKAQLGTKYISSTYKIAIPEGVTSFTMQIDKRKITWPEHDLQTAYENFKSSYEVEVPFENFCNFLSDYYGGFYKRIVRDKKLIDELKEQSGSQVHIVSIRTAKPSDDEPHSDIGVKAPDGRQWTISHNARPGTNINGVCTIISSWSHKKSNDGLCGHQIAAADGVQIYTKYYKEGSEYPFHFFANTKIHEDIDPHKKGELSEKQNSDKDSSEKINH